MFQTRAYTAAVLGLLMSMTTVAVATASDYGVVVTPRNFPKHTPADVDDMFKRGRDLGKFVVIPLSWESADTVALGKHLLGLSANYGLTPILQFTALKSQRNTSAEVVVPKAVAEAAGKRAGFTNDEVSAAFIETARDLAALQPAYLTLGTDVNLLARTDKQEYEAFVATYKRAYDEVKAVSPQTRVFVTFQYEALLDGDGENLGDAVKAFRPKLDVLAVNSDPSDTFDTDEPSSIPADYYAPLAAAKRKGEASLIQVGWPSQGKNGEKRQLEFVERLPSLLSSAAPDFVAWRFLHDIKILIFTVRSGLLDAGGDPKPAFAAFGGDASRNNGGNASVAAKGTAAAAVTTAAVAGKAAGKEKTAANGKRPRQGSHRFSIKDDTDKSGIFDVSVEYGNDDIGWLAYSRVQLPEYVETRIARSNDRGATWEFVTLVNKSEAGTFDDDGKSQKGTWRHETPSLVFDRDDTEGRRWKLFSQRYFAKSPYKKGDSLFHKGWIEYRYAATPAGPWSEPVRVFGGKESGSLVDLNTLDPALRDNAFYNEIGTLAKDGVLYVSLDASVTPTGLGKWGKRKIIMVASQDHGMSWQYVGVLTDSDDAKEFGYLVLTGSSLVNIGAKTYAMLTPSGKKGFKVKTRGHDGAYVVEFEDLSHAKLKRDRDGNLVVTKKLEIAESSHSGGLTDYDEKNTAGGTLFPQINVEGGGPVFFQTFSTGDSIVDP